MGAKPPGKKRYFMHLRDFAVSTKNGLGSKGGPTIGGPYKKFLLLWEEGGPKH